MRLTDECEKYIKLFYENAETKRAVSIFENQHISSHINVIKRPYAEFWLSISINKYVI